MKKEKGVHRVVPDGSTVQRVPDDDGMAPPDEMEAEPPTGEPTEEKEAEPRIRPSSLACQWCGSKEIRVWKTYGTASVENLGQVRWRRYRCSSCHREFTTRELANLPPVEES